MKRTTIGLVALLTAGLFLLQFEVLEKTKVQRLERASQNLGELRVSTLLPTYIGSLFLGSFRAVAIDILWIQMHRMGEEEHRYFERVEYMDLITQLQPRNPEAWAYLGWDAAYNIANQLRTEEDEEFAAQLEQVVKQGGPQAAEAAVRLKKLRDTIRTKNEQYRRWIQEGLLRLLEGSRHLPDDPYLKAEIGKTLQTKASFEVGIFDHQFLQAVEDDKVLQEALGDGVARGRPLTALELSEIWYRKGGETLERQIRKGEFHLYRTIAESLMRAQEGERQHHTTQMGGNYDRGAFVGFQFVARYLHGCLFWRRALQSKDAAAARAMLLDAGESFRHAQDRAAVYRKEHSTSRPGRRDLHDARVDLCQGMADLSAEAAQLPWPLEAADRAQLLARLELIRWNPVDRTAPPDQAVPPVDDRHVLHLMSALKRSLGGDAWEYNDDRYALYRGNLLMTGQRADATIGPTLDDADWYHFYAAKPAEAAAGGHTHDEPEPAAGPLTSDFEMKNVGKLEVSVTVLAFARGTIAVVEHFDVAGGGSRKFAVTSDREGPVSLLVSAKSPSRSVAADSGYWIKALGVRH